MVPKIPAITISISVLQWFYPLTFKSHLVTLSFPALNKTIKGNQSMELYVLQVVCLLLFPLVTLLLCYQNPKKKPTSTGVRCYPLLGNLPGFVKNRHRFLDWTTEVLSQNPTHTMGFQSLGQVSGIITANPTNVEHLLKTNFHNYPKGHRTISMMEDFLGHGIFNSDGEHWKLQRKAASFEFNKRSLRNFVMDTVQHEIVERLLPLLGRAAAAEETLDLQDVLERFGFDNICKVAFGEDPACLAKADKASEGFMKAFGEVQALISDRFMDALDCTWRVKKLLDVGSERRLKESIWVVNNYAIKIIKSRKDRIFDQRDDLLSRFASNPDNTEEFLRDIVISFILAGRETTSSALTWFFWVMSTRPDVVKEILDEVKRVRSQSQNHNSYKTFSFDELREMHYLHAAISESLRLYPPVPLDTQSCREDDTMPDGTFVGKKWFVTYSAYAMGRMKDIWGEDCMDYKPERWLENGVFQPENPFRFPVFHAGPRMCLGKEMAYIQMKSIAACVLERFEINPVKKEEKGPEPLLSLTLKMKGGLQIRVRARSC